MRPEKVKSLDEQASSVSLDRVIPETVTVSKQIFAEPTTVEMTASIMKQLGSERSWAEYTLYFSHDSAPNHGEL